MADRVDPKVLVQAVEALDPAEAKRRLVRLARVFGQELDVIRAHMGIEAVSDVLAGQRDALTTGCRLIAGEI